MSYPIFFIVKKMKESRFNIYLEYKGATILYNTLSEKIIMLSNELKRRIDSSGLICTGNENNAFYQSLLGGGMLIDDTCNEDELIEGMIKKEDFSESEYHLIINPTLDCNFDCWYCFEQKIRGSAMQQSVSDACIKLIANIISSKEDIRKFTLSFFGGEPLLYYKKTALPIINALHERIKGREIEPNIHFTTNGYLLSPSLLYSMNSLGVSSLQITFDGDREHHNQTRFSNKGGSYDKIVQNIKMILSQTDIQVILRINYTRKNIKGFLSLLAEFESSPNTDRIILSPNQVWQDKDLSESESLKVQSILEEIYKRARIIGMYIKEPSGIGRLRHSCYADKKNQACVNFDGMVFKCNARDFKPTSAMGKLNEDGKIIWSDAERLWMSSKYQNAACRKCSIFPVCAGGCRRLTYNNLGREYCMYKFDEGRKKQMVLDMLLHEMADN